MPTNDFKTFAAGAGANVLTQAEYLAQTAELANGVTAGTASSKLFNKNLRQASIGTKVLTDYIGNKLNVDTIDDGTTDILTSNLHSAVINSGYADATGSTTAYLANLNPSVFALHDGDKISVDTGAVGTNTTTSPTLNVNGLGAWTIVKDGGALRIGDLPKFAQLQANFTTAQWVLLNPLTLASGLVASGINIVTTTGGLTADMSGGLVRVNSTTATTQTLPAASSYAVGKLLRLVNNNTGVATVTRAGSDTITVNNTTVTSLAMSNGDTLELISDGISKWFAVGGSVQLGYSKTFYSINTAGASIQYLPGGKILQTAQGVNQSAFAFQTITFPMAFPTAVINVYCSTYLDSGSYGNATPHYSLTSSSSPLTNCRVIRSNLETAIGATPLIFAIGY